MHFTRPTWEDFSCRLYIEFMEFTYLFVRGGTRIIYLIVQPSIQFAMHRSTHITNDDIVMTAYDNNYAAQDKGEMNLNERTVQVQQK